MFCANQLLSHFLGKIKFYNLVYESGIRGTGAVHEVDMIVLIDCMVGVVGLASIVVTWSMALFLS